MSFAMDAFDYFLMRVFRPLVKRLAWLTLLFQQIDIALKNQWLRQNRNFLSIPLTY